MKYSAVTVAAFAGSAMAAGGADAINSVLNDINTSVKSFDSAVKGYSGGDAQALLQASSKIQSITADGAAKIAAGSDLTLNDAVSITTNVQGLQGTLDSALSDLEGAGPALAKAGKCSEITSQLSAQADAAKKLQDAVTLKAPTETKSIAQQLGGKIGSSIASTQGKFKQICAGASSAPSSGSSSGSSDHAGMPGMAGSSSSGSSSSSSSSTGSKTKSGKHSASSTVPKPAQYTGAASTMTAPALMALVAAVFAL
ncbi:hypothetical protein BT63DRAFT_313451 [Microthyrium microscopicum]|uniref:Cell wall protein n=1 Tax=Microthyrium microscopicum TaxID=703497 RepID=A0A6A6U5C5_9PEZI|nr:hypothetical protein BT63DRAFT_313451 [Microthyrium microscopicum]